MQRKSISEFLAAIDLSAITISDDGRVFLHDKEVTASSLQEAGLEGIAAASAAPAASFSGAAAAPSAKDIVINFSRCGKALAA